MGSRYRCRVSPSGVPGCTSDGGGTAGSDQGAGTLSFQGGTEEFTTEAGNYIPLSSALWLPTDLENFTDLGFGRMRYDGDSKIALITARISISTADEDEDVVILTYGFNDNPQDDRITSSVTMEGDGEFDHVTISDTVQLDPGSILSLFATTVGGESFTLVTGQLSVLAAG